MPPTATQQATGERRIPCGLCAELVPESHFRSGTAKIVQGTLYCTNCSRAAETARVETVAFRQSLQIGGLYTCAKCDQPVPLQDIKAGTVIYFKGELSCRTCAKDLRNILGVRAPRPQQASGLGQSPLAATSTSASGGFPKQPAPGQTGRIALPPAGKCQLCGIAVSHNQVKDGRALVYEGEYYCPGCKGEVEELIQLSKESVEKLATFRCASCEDPVPADDLVAEQAIRYQGEIYCQKCKATFTKKAAAQERKPDKRVASAAQAVPCAVCQRTISPLEIRLGEALELGGRLHCHRCKLDVEAAKKRLANRAARAVTCALCSRAISPRELEQKRVGYHEGNVYCRGCARHAEIKVVGAASGASSAEQPSATTLLGPSRPDLVGSKAPPPPSRPSVRVAEFSLSSEEVVVNASQELLRAAKSQPCEGQGCANVITEEDLTTGRAVVMGRRTLCVDCANKVSGEVEVQRKAARCARCRTALPPGAKPGAVCHGCMAASSDDEQATSAALSLSGEIELKCAKCARVVETDDIANGKAKTIDGKLYCRRCTGGAQAKIAPSVPGKQCTTCNATIKGAAHAFAGKPCCADCRAEFEKLLGKPPGQPRPCMACKKPAQGDGVLVVDEKCFCAQPACKRQGEFLLLYTVRNRRTKRPIRIPPSVLVAAVAIAGVALAGYGVNAWRDSRRQTVVPDVPAVVQPSESPAKKAMQEARRLAHAPAPTFEAAQKNLAALGRLAPELQGEAAFATEFKQLYTRATATRDSFAPRLAAETVAKADEVAQKDRYEEAIALLGKFPEELLATPAGQDLTRTRARWSAMNTCRGRTLALLASKDPLRFEPMDGIAASADAQLCDFLSTELGKQLNAERRRLRNAYEARQASPTPSDKELASDLDKARKLEATDLAGAEKIYRAILAKDGDSVDAQIGLAQVAIERDRPVAARRELERAVKIAPGRASTRVLEGWLRLLDRKPDAVARARSIIEGLNQKDLGKHGRRLKAITELGAPRRTDPHLRYLAPADVAGGDLEALPAALDSVAATVAQAFGLAPGDDELLVLVFRNLGQLGSIAGKAETTTTQEGRLRGCFAIAVAAPTEEVLRVAIASVLAHRSDAPAWLVVGLPPIVGTGTAPSDVTGTATIEELENQTASVIAADPRLASNAQFYASLFHHPTGPKILNDYVTQRAADRAGARKALEAVAKTLLGR